MKDRVAVPRRFFLWLSAATALATGLLEPPVLLLRRAIQDLPIEGDAQMLWMAPLANLLVFIPLGLVFHLLVRAPGRELLVRAGIALHFAIATFALLAIFPRLYAIAWLLLAAGAGVQISAIVMRHLSTTVRWSRRITAVLGSVAVAALLSTATMPALRESWFRRTVSHPAADAPNILLLVLDTVRWKSLSLAGYERRTSPELEEWAAEGVTFTDAIVTSPWTLPSHGAMFTGRYPHELEAGFKTPLESAHRTLAGTLSELGYATAGFVANRRYASAEFGLHQGFTRYVDYRISLGQLLISSSIWRHILWHPRVQRALNYYDLYGRANAARVNQELLNWIDDTDRPFFAFVNYYDAHDPYLPAEPFDRYFTDDPRRGRPANLEVKQPAEVIERERDMYDGAIAYLDAQLGALRDSLAARGLLDRTLVIITSDHGEHLGEHGMLSHGNSLYSPLLHVPLVLAHRPAIPAGTRVDRTVTLRDLPATIMQLAVPNETSAFPGTPLSRFWEEGADSSDSSPLLAALTWPNGAIAYAIRSGSLIYIDWFEEREELYDLSQGGETADLAKDPTWEAELVRMRGIKDSLVGHVRRGPERGM